MQEAKHIYINKKNAGGGKEAYLVRWRRWFAGGAAVVVAVSSLHGRRLLSPLLQGFSLFLSLFVFFLCFGVPLFLSFFCPVLSLSFLYL